MSAVHKVASTGFADLTRCKSLKDNPGSRPQLVAAGWSRLKLRCPPLLRLQTRVDFQVDGRHQLVTRVDFQVDVRHQLATHANFQVNGRHEIQK